MHERNNKCRPLLALSVRDSYGNVMVMVQCFAPNERSWLFRRLFQEFLPVVAAGGILFIKAVDKNVEVKAFRREREKQPEVRLE